MFSNETRKQLFGDAMRHERDFYPTPQSIIDAILFRVKLRETATIWEPCAGDGRFSTALEQSGYRVISHDIEEGHNFFDWKTAQAPAITFREPDLAGGLSSDRWEPGQVLGHQHLGDSLRRNDCI